MSEEHEPLEDYCELCGSKCEEEKEEYDWDDDAWDIIT